MKVSFGNIMVEWHRAVKVLNAITVVNRIDHDSDLIIASTAEDIKYCLDNNLKYIGPDLATFNLLNNKYDFKLWMMANFGKNIPELYEAKINGVKKVYKEIQYPAIFKPVESLGGKGVEIIYEAPESDNYIIEQAIRTEKEYGVHFYIKDGIVKKWFAFSEIVRGIKAGAMTKYSIVPNYPSIFDDIFYKLNYNGFACANYKIDSDIKIFEINPRLGGTVVLNESMFKKFISAI